MPWDTPPSRVEKPWATPPAAYKAVGGRSTDALLSCARDLHALVLHTPQMPLPRTAVRVILLAGTLLPLQAAAAGAGVVAADLLAFLHRLLLDGAVAAAGLAGDLGHPLPLDLLAASGSGR